MVRRVDQGRRSGCRRRRSVTRTTCTAVAARHLLARLPLLPDLAALAGRTAPAGQTGTPGSAIDAGVAGLSGWARLAGAAVSALVAIDARSTRCAGGTIRALGAAVARLTVGTLRRRKQWRLDALVPGTAWQQRPNGDHNHKMEKVRGR